MPPKRKSAGGPAASTRGAQSTLSFNSKKGNSRVTKPSTTSTTTKSKDVGAKIAALEDETVRPESRPESPIVEEVRVIDGETAQVEVVKPQPRVVAKGAREVEAEKVSDAAVKKYWKKEEESRIAPRVHQESLSLHEKILRHFDLSSQYGPCIGISRLKRWKRAENLDLNPPVEVLAVLLREEDAETNKKVPEAAKGKWKKAYVDELMEGGAALVD